MGNIFCYAKQHTLNSSALCLIPQRGHKERDLCLKYFSAPNNANIPMKWDGNMKYMLMSEESNLRKAPRLVWYKRPLNTVVHVLY